MPMMLAAVMCITKNLVRAEKANDGLPTEHRHG
jgi:hypothetical protein